MLWWKNENNLKLRGHNVSENLSWTKLKRKFTANKCQNVSFILLSFAFSIISKFEWNREIFYWICLPVLVFSVRYDNKHEKSHTFIHYKYCRFWHVHSSIRWKHINELYNMLNKYHPEGNIWNYENEKLLERNDREKNRKWTNNSLSEIKTQSTFIPFMYPLIKWPFTAN